MAVAGTVVVPQLVTHCTSSGSSGSGSSRRSDTNQCASSLWP